MCEGEDADEPETHRWVPPARALTGRTAAFQGTGADFFLMTNSQERDSGAVFKTLF